MVLKKLARRILRKEIQEELDKVFDFAFEQGKVIGILIGKGQAGDNRGVIVGIPCMSIGQDKLAEFKVVNANRN